MNYREMLILSYFKCHYKKYEFHEIMQLLGISLHELNRLLDTLIEKRMLLICGEYIVLSKIAEDELQENRIPLIGVDMRKNNKKEKMNTEEIYIPVNFKL